MLPDSSIRPGKGQDPLADTLFQVQKECLRLQQENDNLRAQLALAASRAERIAGKVLHTITILSGIALALSFGRKLRRG